MADGSPVISRIGGSEAEFRALLEDTDKRLTELERISSYPQNETAVIAVGFVEDLPPNPWINTFAWVIDEQQVYSVQAGGGSGGENGWSPGGSIPGWP